MELRVWIKMDDVVSMDSRVGNLLKNYKSSEEKLKLYLPTP